LTDAPSTPESIAAPAPSSPPGLLRRVRSWLAQPAVRHALAAMLVTRLAVFLIGYLAVATIGHAPNVGPQPDNELAGLPGRWDAGWYLGIAAGGYRWEPDRHNPRVAFFPGYPMALRLAGRALRLPQREPPWLWTGVAVSCVFFFAGLIYAYRLAERFAGPDRAAPTIWLLACYPYSVFYGQVYTESLFLLTIAGSWYAMERERPWTAALFGLMAGLVKPTGCLVALLVAWPALRQLMHGDRSAGRVLPRLAAVVSPGLGLIGYSAYLKYVTGAWTAWMSAHATWGRVAKNPLELATEFGAAIAHQGLAGFLQARPYDAFNAAATLFGLASVVPVARRFGPGTAAFVLASLAIPLTAGGLMSIGRFTSVLLPIFVWLGARTNNPTPLIVAFALFEGFFAALFFTDRPIF